MGATTKIQWCPIPGRPGYYVTRDGQVGSAWLRGRGARIVAAIRPMRQSVSANGYACLRTGRRRRRVLVHRLVLETFVGARPPGMQCRHLNGDRLDNRLENLAWGTPKENARDQYRHGTRVAGEAHFNARHSSTAVRRIRLLWAAGFKQVEIAKLVGCRQSTVSRVVNRKSRVTAQEDA